MTRNVFMAHYFGFLALFSAYLWNYACEQKRNRQRAKRQRSKRNSSDSYYTTGLKVYSNR